MPPDSDGSVMLSLEVEIDVEQSPAYSHDQNYEQEINLCGVDPLKFGGCLLS